MKKIAIVILANTLAVFSMFACGKNHDTRFSNPVTAYDWPDPTIWYSEGRFYSVATGVGAVLTSTDLANWTILDNPPLSSEARARAKAIGRHFWAPDVTRIGDSWMMYLTCYNSSTDCGIVALTSKNPSGPFDYVGLITHSKDNGISDTIDPEVLTDPATGKVWLFFGSVGKVHRVQLSDDGRSLAPGATFTHVAGLTYSQDNTRNKVFEGSYLYQHGGYWYLFVSSGNYSNASYKIKVGRSESLEGEFLDKDGRKMTEGNATAVLSSKDGDNFYGPGHDGEIFTDLRGQEYMLYHCHDKSSGKSSRFTFLQRIYWDEAGWPYFETGKPLAEELAPKF